MKTLEEVKAIVAQNIKTGKYNVLPKEDGETIIAYYISQIPSYLPMEESNLQLFTKNGLRIATGYERIVVGHYGAYIEIALEHMLMKMIKVQPGQEYRRDEEFYRHRVKYFWYTPIDNSGLKVYWQQRTVGYADYRPNMFYVGVNDVLHLHAPTIYTTTVWNKDKIPRGVFLDISVKGQDDLGKIFAPTWDIVLGVKNGTITEEQYIKAYRDILNKSYRENRLKWDSIFMMGEVYLACYCAPGQFCHRKILAEIFGKLGAVYKGEWGPSA